MSAVVIFLVGLVITLSSTLLVVIYLRGPLKAILIDLCGTAERAAFWTAFSNVTLVLVPVTFALSDRPEAGSWPSLLFALGGQLESALIGLICSVVALGIVLNTFIRRRDVSGAPAQGARTA